MRQFIQVFTIFVLLCASSVMADTITVARSISFAADSGASQEVIDECEMQTRLPEYIKKEGKRKVDIELSKESLEDVEGKVLHLEITNVYAPGGGAYSGSKSVIAAGELKENDEVIASMTIRRHSMMGMMPGTCSIMKRIAKKMGEDISIWLAEPTMNAELGDLEDEDHEADDNEDEES
jgi:hypothetical protein